MREIRPSGSEGGEEFYPLSLPLSRRIHAKHTTNPRSSKSASLCKLATPAPRKAEFSGQLSRHFAFLVVTRRATGGMQADATERVPP